MHLYKKRHLCDFGVLCGYNSSLRAFASLLEVYFFPQVLSYLNIMIYLGFSIENLAFKIWPSFQASCLSYLLFFILHLVSNGTNLRIYCMASFVASFWILNLCGAII